MNFNTTLASLCNKVTVTVQLLTESDRQNAERQPMLSLERNVINESSADFLQLQCNEVYAPILEFDTQTKIFGRHITFGSML